MKVILVKDLMVPLSEYATVAEEATLFDAVAALEKAQQEYGLARYPHRAILVCDENKNVVGKVSQYGILRALEPKYEKLGDSKSMTRFGFSPRFLKLMLKQFSLWDKPLDDICRKAGQKKVKTFMYIPTEGEYIEEDAGLNEAIHMVVVGRHDSLLVTRDKKVVGILRKTDVYNKVAQSVLACEL
jgi:CBS domain-containing protein